MPNQKPGTARNRMLTKRVMLSLKLLGRNALTIATGIPTIHDKVTDNSALRRQRPAPQDHLGDAFGAEERMPEAAARDIPDPAQVLHDQRVAQTELRHITGALSFAELGVALRAEDRHERVARQNPQHEEDDDRNADHGERAEG